jgi:hypothetical protein
MVKLQSKAMIMYNIHTYMSVCHSMIAGNLRRRTHDCGLRYTLREGRRRRRRKSWFYSSQNLGGTKWKVHRKLVLQDHAFPPLSP